MSAVTTFSLEAVGLVRLMTIAVPEPLVIDLDEAATFCASSVVVGRVVVMPDCPPRVAR
ncbi:MAG TPA: hypothetical protein VFY45_18040 [Baekduia sp.]|nr:hypothetical protein [Baekduia sp.]